MTEIEVVDKDEGGVEARCPECNEIIFDMENPAEDLACEHVLMVYAGCCSEVVFCHEKLEEVVEEMEEKVRDGAEKDEDIEMTDLMQEYANKNGYEVYTITTSGIACGPVSYTDYYLIGKLKAKKSKKAKKAKK